MLIRRLAFSGSGVIAVGRLESERRSARAPAAQIAGFEIQRQAGRSNCGRPDSRDWNALVDLWNRDALRLRSRRGRHRSSGNPLDRLDACNGYCPADAERSCSIRGRRGSSRRSRGTRFRGKREQRAHQQTNSTHRDVPLSTGRQLAVLSVWSVQRLFRCAMAHARRPFERCHDMVTREVIASGRSRPDCAGARTARSLYFPSAADFSAPLQRVRGPLALLSCTLAAFAPRGSPHVTIGHCVTQMTERLLRVSPACSRWSRSRRRRRGARATFKNDDAHAIGLSRAHRVRVTQ